MVAPKKDGESLDRGDRPDPIDGWASPARGRAAAAGLTERLRDAPRGESDGDLVIGRSDVENGVLQWLRALDLQVLGACRADERLKPLLKLNISTGPAEDTLISQLNQHFEASEVGLLARCLCVPLVSIRVGKVNKQGNLLCPTATRGHLNLSLLPSSNVRISFTGDDGCTERLAVLSGDIENSEVDIEEISEDSSSRSFLLKLPGSQVIYFWCSEKSTDHGLELLAKMKNLLREKPSLARLTGICESRLDSFGAHMRTYILGSLNTEEADSLTLLGESLANLHAGGSDFHSAPMVSKSSRYRFAASHTTKGQSFHQGSLSPRPNTFKDGTARSSFSVRNGIKDKLRRKGDGYHSSVLAVSQPSTPVSTLCTHFGSQCEDDSIRGSYDCNLLPSIAQSEIPCLSSLLSLPIPLSINCHPPPMSASCSLFSPYYCWCPPCPSSFQYSVTSSPLPVTFDESMPLPPLPSLWSTALPLRGTSSIPLDVPKRPILNLPPLLPEPLVCLPVPVTSLVALPSSQQFSTFTSYICDSTVHTPMINVYSTGQGYLVSADPAISSVIPPLFSGFVNHPLILCTESAVEKSTREALTMLMTSAPVSTCLKPMIVLPEIDEINKNMFSLHGRNHDAVAATSQGSPLDVETIAMGLSSMGLLSSSTVAENIKDGKLERNDHDCAEDGFED